MNKCCKSCKYWFESLDKIRDPSDDAPAGRNGWCINQSGPAILLHYGDMAEWWWCCQWEMPKTRVIILCAGKAHRFGGVRKQLVKIGQDTILSRIIKQCQYYNVVPHIAVRDTGISVDGLDSFIGCYQWFFAENHDTTCDTILSTQKLWEDRTIILLGDAIYSPDTIRKIFNCNESFCVFGNSFELFAVVFKRQTHEAWIRALENGAKFKFGKIRYAYKYLVGLQPDCQEKTGYPPGPHFVYAHDWTRDVDTQGEYNNTIKELVNTGKLKDNYV